MKTILILIMLNLTFVSVVKAGDLENNYQTSKTNLLSLQESTTDSEYAGAVKLYLGFALDLMIDYLTKVESASGSSMQNEIKFLQRERDDISDITSRESARKEARELEEKWLIMQSNVRGILLSKSVTKLKVAEDRLNVARREVAQMESLSENATVADNFTKFEKSLDTLERVIDTAENSHDAYLAGASTYLQTSSDIRDAYTYLVTCREELVQLLDSLGDISDE